MGMTMTQKILAAHAGLDSVTAGQLISAKLDIVLGNDITTPVAVNEFKKAGFTEVFDKDKVAIVLDHFVPNKDIKAAEQSKQCREFACSHCISHFYDVGKMGIEHALLPSRAWLLPVTASSAQTPTPVLMARWAHSPPAWAVRTWLPVWLPVWLGSKCPLPSSSS